ncbi:MAG: phage tail sheath subtilisin-like domain-containing protein [Bacteroidota bacterium]|nr:phage tail sheath subtilisin-like domain-containing protein [Bacteroidota bacterium]
MASNYKTPGVYIEEKNAFPNSVVEVATAVPAFIGYTEYAVNGTKEIWKQPYRISSLADFHQHFGGAPDYTFAIAPPVAPAASDFQSLGVGYALTQDGGNYMLYRSMRLFFDNGGGPCYIVAMGKYGDTIDLNAFDEALSLLKREQEPTMIVIPDLMAAPQHAVPAADIYTMQGRIIDHCGYTMQSRVAILDVVDGWLRADSTATPIKNFRGGVTSDFLQYSAAYYPWVYSSVVSPSDVDFRNISEKGKSLIDILEKEVDDNFAKKFIDADKQTSYKTEIAKIGTADAKTATVVHNTLMVISPAYISAMNELRKKLNLLPPSGAMAGVYARVDHSRGVWKAPANVTMASVISPAVNLTSEDQEDLNITLQGKSINAIRSFIGEGTLVWGARTLDGNSQDWRYVNVRRTMIMLEQSVKAACKAYVFEPNDANTWVGVKSMINNFLTGKWKDGALAGAKPDDAFDVQIGLGSTMTANDILDGYMNVTVKVAISRPAEFIVITFQQQMQKS